MRLEPSSAAGRGIPVVVVLVDGGRVPPADELPADMHILTTAPWVDASATAERIVAALDGLAAPAEATLRVCCMRARWSTGEGLCEVRADDVPIGTTVVGARTSTAFTVAAGTWSITVGRDRRWSAPLTVTLRPGQVVDVQFSVPALRRPHPTLARR